jgi:hypothetical protein
VQGAKKIFEYTQRIPAFEEPRQHTGKAKRLDKVSFQKIITKSHTTPNTSPHEYRYCQSTKVCRPQATLPKYPQV